MKFLTPKFFLSFGLTSMLISILLMTMFLGLMPDRQGLKNTSRALFSESLASSSSLFLQKNDFSGIRNNLEFAIDRHPDLVTASVYRLSDESNIVIGVPLDEIGFDYEDSMMTVPVFKGNREWGAVKLYYTPTGGLGWISRLQNSRLALLGLVLICSFISFYLYLGKMLKQLNPSSAVPARVRSALDTIAESLIVMNRRGEIMLANIAFAKLCEKDPEELLGTKVADLPWSMTADQQDLSLPWTYALEENIATKNDMIWFGDETSGRRKFIVNCSPVAGRGGKAGGVLVSLDDVTLLEQKEMELVRSKEEAISASHAKSDFLSNMSHEIRTPMTAILGFTEVLKRGYSEDEAASQKYLNTISSSGKHLLGLINDILDLSKVESGALEVESIKCSPAKIVHDVIQVLKVKAEEKDIFLRNEFTQSLPEYVYSDPARLRQIITNLVGNAIKFTEAGGVFIELRMLENNQGSQLVIDVRDTGIGMTEESQANVFEAFAQADTSITRRFGGTGLGLSISRDLTEALGGDISVQSKFGEGSTFTVTISTGDISQARMLSPEELMEAAEKSTESNHTRWEFTNSKVLIVDDAAENRDLLTVILGQLGIESDTAENGKIGVEKALSGSFDLVLMDIQMPVMDGYQAVAELRKNAFELPIIALTANAMKGFEEKVLAAGFSHYMTKPIDLDRLTQLLAMLLNGVEVPDALPEILNTKPSIVESVDETGKEDDTIYSSLVQEKLEFQPIVESFIGRLDEKLKTLQDAIDANQLEEISACGHWLKGSGGSVGFHDFTEPAGELEVTTDPDRIRELMAVIRGLASRLDSSVMPASIAKQITVSKPTSEITAETNDEAARPLVSTLVAENSAFQGIVERFVPKLQERIADLKVAVDEQNYEVIADIGHWLKGSAGNVGFHDFTEPAGALEAAAKQSDLESVKNNLLIIEGYASRVTVSVGDEFNKYKKSA